jgi:hypothetical protein
MSRPPQRGHALVGVKWLVPIVKWQSLQWRYNKSRPPYALEASR